MKYAVEVVTLGDYADPRAVVRVAQAAERAGWDGLFVWDHLAFAWGAPSGDPWVILAAVAQATERLRIGTEITPIARRRPHVLAHTLATLDLLSNGRVIFGAGLGGVEVEFAAFGEEADAKLRAERLDEGLTVLDGLLSGRTVEHHGKHYTVAGITLAPLPVQRPRIPIWIGGASHAALRRAARWNGWATSGADQDGNIVKTPDRLREQVAYILACRTVAEPFDVAISGLSEPGQVSLARAYAEAGATWWLESLHGFRGSAEEMLARVAAGPPRA